MTDLDDSAPPNSWLYGLVSIVSKWVVGDGNLEQTSTLLTNDIEPEDLQEWEWVLSATEEFLQQHAQWRMEKTVNELNSLRNAAQFKMRPYLMEGAVKVLESLTDEERTELEVPLDASKRAAVITDVVRKLEDEWAAWIKNTFFTEDETFSRFESSYREQPYSKNTIGILVCILDFCGACIINAHSRERLDGKLVTGQMAHCQPRSWRI